ncbi:MAG TPA: carboxypeptidase-like regulatory domain-containing protein [Bacteroidota bacterium]
MKNHHSHLRLLLSASLLAGMFSSSNAQGVLTVGGTVIDAISGVPIPFVNIVVRGTNSGTSTDSLGNFTLLLDTDELHVVTVTHIGYEKWVKEFIALSPREIRWTVKLPPQTISFSEVSIVAQRPFIQRRAKYVLTAADFEKIGEPDMDRALRHLLPEVASTWDARVRDEEQDFTLYLDGVWKESFNVFSIDPYTVKQLLVWEPRLSPIGMPVVQGNLVVSIETQRKQ